MIKILCLQQRQPRPPKLARMSLVLGMGLSSCGMYIAAAEKCKEFR